MSKFFLIVALAASAVCVAGEKTVLWKGGDGGIAVYRIPALCTAPNGDLVAVCDARRDNIGDLNAFQPINIVCRRSSDGGKTWTPSEPTWKWPWTDTDKWSGSDPSFIVDAKAKKIFLLYNVWHWKNPDGSDRWGNVYRFHVQESSDNGKTWSKPRDITDSISFPEWPFGKGHNKGGFIFISSGSGIQTKDGTLLHTLVHVNDGNALFGSDDHGKTWKSFGKPVKPGDECKVVELKDGSWMINSRWRGGGRQIHVSKDRGMTWQSRYDKSLADPQCNAQIMRYGDRLLFSNCKSPTRRALLHLRESLDDGTTWSDGFCVEPTGAAYSDMAILPNGDIAVIYEGAGYKTIVFTVVPADTASARFTAAWESRRGEPYVEVPVSPPIFHGHPRFAQKYSRAIIHFALRVFHNAETNEYALANRKIAENCRFYIENKDVRNDRDSFYWNVGELCRIVLHYGSKGDVAPRLLSSEAEAAFLEMAFGYCHDMSKLSDAAADGMKTWRVYESENHHVQRDSALWQLMHALLKVDPAYGARKLAHGGTLRAHYDAWEEFFCAWMRERAKRSMFIEVQSRVYGIHTIKNVYPFYDFAEHPETRRIAKNFIDLFWALWAQEQIDGASGGGMSRVYPSAAVKTASEASAWAYWYFGLNPSLAHKPDGMDYVCLDSAYRPHPLIGRIAADAKARGVYEIEMRPLGWTLPSDKYPNYRPDPEWGRIYRYTYATPDFIVGTQMFPQASGDKWCKISSQNRFHGVVFGPRDAEILPIPAVTGRHAKTVKLPSVGYNAFWSMQRKGTLLTRKNRYANQTGGMRVFFSAAGGVDKVERDGEWWFAKCGGTYSAVRVACGEARLVGAGAGAEIPFDAKGKFLVCADPWAPVIVETARACEFKDEAAFRAKVKATVLSVTPSALDYTGIYGNRFHMLLDCDDGSTIDGEPYVRKIDWSVKSPFVRMPWCGDEAELTFDGSTVRLDFSDKVFTNK